MNKMTPGYTRSKEEYEHSAQEARSKHGDTLKLPATRLHQRDSVEMLTVPLRTDLCHLLFQRLPRDLNNHDGIQRAYKTGKIGDIANVAKNDPLYTAPGAVVATVHTKDRTWVRCEWDTDNRRGNLVVNLKEIQNRLKKLDPDEEGALEEEKFKIGYMIDAHHRTEGHYQAGE